MHIRASNIPLLILILDISSIGMAWHHFLLVLFLDSPPPGWCTQQYVPTLVCWCGGGVLVLLVCWCAGVLV
jgi:hypothetical protein